MPRTLRGQKWRTRQIIRLRMACRPWLAALCIPLGNTGAAKFWVYLRKRVQGQSPSVLSDTVHVTFPTPGFLPESLKRNTWSAELSVDGEVSDSVPHTGVLFSPYIQNKLIFLRVNHAPGFTQCRQSCPHITEEDTERERG